MRLMSWRRSAIVVGLVLLVCGTLYWYQTRSGIKTLADPASWFKVQRVAEGVWRIDDNGGDNVYLVTGRDSALLVDTGTGSADLAACVRRLTTLRLTVINTHGHPDHAGGDFQFAEVRAHPDDFDMILNVANHAGLVERLLRRVPVFKSSAQAAGVFERRQLVPVKAGQIIDLGDRRIEVLETPGHTKGSICLLDASHKLLLTGDNDNTLVWLFLKGCLPIEAYLKTLQALQRRAGEYETILPGHGVPLDSAFVDEQITCAESILSGACKGEPYQNPFGVAARVCSYKRASITFDPENLRAR
jgi:hydroxyacylglutathione hydrolase